MKHCSFFLIHSDLLKQQKGNGADNLQMQGNQSFPRHLQSCRVRLAGHLAPNRYVVKTVKSVNATPPWMPTITQMVQMCLGYLMERHRPIPPPSLDSTHINEFCLCFNNGIRKTKEKPLTHAIIQREPSSGLSLKVSKLSEGMHLGYFGFNYSQLQSNS